MEYTPEFLLAAAATTVAALAFWVGVAGWRRARELGSTIRSQRSLIRELMAECEHGTSIIEGLWGAWKAAPMPEAQASILLAAHGLTEDDGFPALVVDRVHVAETEGDENDE